MNKEYSSLINKLFKTDKMPQTFHHTKSSNLMKSEYDADSETLRVHFKNGKSYTYSGVSPEIVEEFIKAPSAGKYFIQNIRGKFITNR